MAYLPSAVPETEPWRNSYKAGISALDVPKLKIVFITHPHSDHTLCYPDLIFSPWVMERTEPLTAYGPRGLRVMTAHIEKGWQEDIRVRTQGPEKANRTAYRVLVHEITSGVVCRDPNVTVTAFAVAAGTFACTSHKGIADPLSLIVHSRLCLSSVRGRRLVNTGR